MLAEDMYAEGVFFPSALNPADDPTRGVALRKPTKEPPVWWDWLRLGNYDLFDKWLLENGLDGFDLAGIPPFAELNAGKELVRREVHEQPTTSASSPGAGPVETAKVEQTATRVGGARESNLSPVAQQLLNSWPKDQFIFPPGDKGEFLDPGYLDLFSGARGVAESWVQQTRRWALCFDIEHSPTEDLADSKVRSLIWSALEAGAFVAVGMGPVCSSFSLAITPPVRTREHPMGLPEVSEKMREKIELGNSFALWCFDLLRRACQLGLAAWLENPHTSWMFRIPAFWDLLQSVPELGHWVVDYCRFNRRWRKRTRFVCNTLLTGHKTLCTGGHEHILLRGRSAFHRKSWTMVAQPYPPGVAYAVAASMALTVGLRSWEGRFDPAACAKITNCRVGEASKPGPPRKNRTELLEDVLLVEPRTAALQSTIFAQFVQWLESTLSEGAQQSVFRHPALLVQVAKSYASFLYSSGRSLYQLRHLILILQREFVETKLYTSVLWDMVSRWELLEPTQHRTPVPKMVFRAMVSTALLWNWERTAGIIVIAFAGITRPGEPLRALRKHVVFPGDALEPDRESIYLIVDRPKSRNRGTGRVQHSSIRDREFFDFLFHVFGPLEADQPIFNASPSAFRRRWDALLKALFIPKSAGLTPGGLRAGGCVSAFQESMDIRLLMWRMRVRHQITLESYLQEVTASSVIPELEPRSRKAIAEAANVLPFLLSRYTRSRTAKGP